MKQHKYKFDRNRNIAKFCPCGKDNKNGKFVPFKGFDSFGYCHSCNEIFSPDNGTIETPFNKYVATPEPTFHNHDLVSQSGRNYKQNNFIQFLKTIFSEDEIKNVILKYLIGTSKHWSGATVFWQIDNNELVHAGKILQYVSDTGKRFKTTDGKGLINWVHSVMKLKDFNLNQCLFGLHLINETNQKTIALVESEKTAVIMSIFKPEYVWLSTGSKQGFKYEMLKPIKEFKIIAFPDKSEFEDWNHKAIELNDFGFNIVVNDWLEQTDYEDGTDFADVYLIEKKITGTSQISYTDTEMIVHGIEEYTPVIRLLIEAFDLVDKNGNEIRKNIFDN